jgi:hypothetical protein
MKEKTLWSEVRDWLNHQEGAPAPYQVKDFIVGIYPNGNRNQTHYGPHYRVRSYHSLLFHLGFMERVSRGRYTLKKQIPEWFTLGHAQFLRGWARYDKRGKKATHYQGLTRDMLQAKLNYHTATSAPTAQPPETFVAGSYAMRDTHVLIGTKIIPATTQVLVSPYNDLISNLKENVGLVHAALLVLDQVEIIDPLMQGRIINVFQQVKSIYESMSDRISATKISSEDLVKLINAK